MSHFTTFSIVLSVYTYIWFLGGKSILKKIFLRKGDDKFSLLFTIINWLYASWGVYNFIMWIIK